MSCALTSSDEVPRDMLSRAEVSSSNGSGAWVWPFSDAERLSVGVAPPPRRSSGCQRPRVRRSAEPVPSSVVQLLSGETDPRIGDIGRGDGGCIPDSHKDGVAPSAASSGGWCAYTAPGDTTGRRMGAPTPIVGTVELPILFIAAFLFHRGRPRAFTRNVLICAIVAFDCSMSVDRCASDGYGSSRFALNQRSTALSRKSGTTT